MLPNGRQESKPGPGPRPTASPSYDPENEGAWNGQLAVPGMPSAEPEPVERKTGGHHDRQTWANQFMPAVGHGTFKVLTLLAEYANPKGQCWPSMELLRHRSGMSDRALRRGFSDLRGKGIVEAGHPGLAVWQTNPYQLSGGLNGWTCAESGIGPVPKVAQVPVPKVAHITRDSSSNPKINPRDPGAVDAKRVDHVDHPGPETGVTTGVKFSFLEEEGVTGTGPKDYQAFQDFVDDNLSEIPTDSEIEPLAKHCWPAWAKHWGGGWAAAWPTWTKDAAGRKKFRSDVVAQIQKVGLPQPMAPDADDDRARERSAAWMDQRLEEAPQRMVDVKCAGCGKSRQLPPGETRCQPCRKDLVEIAA